MSIRKTIIIRPRKRLEHAKCVCPNLITDTLMSTSGVIFERAPENVPCCLQRSISSLEDGTSYRWPWVDSDDSCRGGTKRTFQEWVDLAVNANMRLCFNGWLYSRKGTLIKITLYCHSFITDQCE